MFNLRGLLAGAAFLAASGALQACAGPCGGCGPAPAPAPAPCATRTVTVYEMVPEHYQTTRTTYKTEYVNETYTAYRHECVPETRTCTKTVYKKVPEWRDECRTSYKCITVQEPRCVTKKVAVWKEVTTVHKKWEDRGHWECQLVPAKSFFGGFKKKGCGDECCDPCPPMKEKKVWVPCKVCVETPCTKKVKCWETVTCTEMVCVKKSIPVHETVKVCTYKCVPECVTHTYTVNVSRCVPYQATRCVAKCVPVVENVTACRMVCKPVTKVVPVTDCCASPCSDDCGCRSHKKSFSLNLGGLFSKKSSCCD